MARGNHNREQGVPVIASARPALQDQEAAAGSVPELATSNLVLRRAAQGMQYGRHMRIAAVLCTVVALVCCLATVMSGNNAPEKPRELLWNPYALEDSSAQDHDLWGGRQMVADILRERSAHIATRVGRRFQDDDRIGELLGHAAHVAFDTIVEIKRALRGVQYDEGDAIVVNSKIEVAETMLAHLMSKLGITEVPPPPHTTRLASVKNAMRMARDLRMMLSKIPTGNDAKDSREVSCCMFLPI